MKDFYFSQVFLCILGAAILAVFANEWSAISYVVGVLLITLNMLVLKYSWKRAIDKKPVAWTVFVIVSKYTLFSVVLYLVAAREVLEIKWFALGLLTLMVSVFRLKPAK